jgi:hypothetical protein
MLKDLRETLAITMWDSSWLRRRYAGGGFEDWDLVLDELVARGYNAVRIDAFPHLVARSPSGELVEVFRDIPGQHPHYYGFAVWGNQWTIRINPRKSLVEFIRKCEARRVRVALSTWFKPTEDLRNARIEGPDELARVWEETLDFLEDQGCLSSVLYVDVLNEYPYGHCLWWLHKVIDTQAQPEQPDGRLNSRQVETYRSFMDRVLERLKKKRPRLPFAASKTMDWLRQYDLEQDFGLYDFLDVHIWAPESLHEGTGYREHVACHGRPDRMFTHQRLARSGYGLEAARVIPGDVHYEDVYQRLLARLEAERETCRRQIERDAGAVRALGDRWGVPVGNTEGWGLVFWAEHPSLDWDIQKELGMMGAEAGSRNGYSFNCSSNFCHPQFIRLWRDAGWHTQVTSAIRRGRPVVAGGRGATVAGKDIEAARSTG